MTKAKTNSKVSVRGRNAETAKELLKKAQTAYVKRDFETTAKFLKEAAAKGNVEAQCYLGICYDNGFGVEQVAGVLCGRTKEFVIALSMKFRMNFILHRLTTSMWSDRSECRADAVALPS